MNTRELMKAVVLDGREDIFYGTVDEVKQDGKFLTVISNLKKNTIPGVKLLSEFNESGLVTIPNVGSKCIVFRYAQNYFATGFSDVKTIYLKGNDNKGLIKIDDLVDKLNTLEDTLNGLIQDYNSHTHIVSVDPVSHAGSATPTTNINTDVLINTTVQDLENPDVLH